MAYDISKNEKSSNNKDILQATVGDFGRWQARISIFMSLLKLPIAWFQLGIVFLAPPTEFWCKRPEDFKYMSVDEWIKYITPVGQNKTHTQHIALQSGSCVMRNIPPKAYDTATFPCRWGYEYNRTIVHNSIITEFNLVCGKERLVDVTQITVMLGVLLGNVIFGIAADKYGRKKILIACIFIQSICGILSSWSPWFIGFLIFRFFLAIANGGTMITSFVMCMEIVGGKWRTIVPILYQIPFGLGNTLMAGFAYFIRDWRHLQLTLSSISGLFIFYLWFVPESPRWLMATGNKKQAIEVLEKGARMNKQDSTKIKDIVMSFNSNVNNEKTKLSLFFSTPELRKRSLLLSVNWLISGITFFAFSQYLGQITHNLYFAVATGGLIAIPGTILCVIIIKTYGRRLTTTCFQLLTAVCFFIIMFIPKGAFKEDWPRIVFAGIGIIGMSISMPALYLFTGELFPTVMRNAGVGGTVMCARIGSMLAPLVIALSDIASYLPLTILGILATIEALLILPLPETCGMQLPETIDDLKHPKKDIEQEVSDIVNGNYIAVPNNVEEETQK